MPANTDPIFTLTPVIGVVTIAAANTNRDGTGAMSIVVDGGNFGTRIEYIRVVATGQVTNGVVRLFINSGTASHLWKEIIVTATTPSTTTEVFNTEYIPTKPLVLPAGYILEASTHNSETFNIYAHGGDY